VTHALGALAAFAAASLFNLGLVVQALEAREAPAATRLRPSLLLRLVRRPRWLAGTALAAAGWPFQLAALALAPLVLVQPALALGLVVLLVAGARLLGEPVAARDVLAVLVILGGVAALTAVAPAAGAATPGAAALGLTLAGLGAVCLLPYALSLAGRAPPVGMMLSAGAGYATTALTSVLVERALSRGALLAAFGWAAATLAIDALALTSEMSALGRAPAVQVGSTVLVVQTVVPVGLGALLLGEWPRDVPAGLALAGAVALILAGAVALVRSPALVAMIDAQRSR
jgi:hypothetical protein